MTWTPDGPAGNESAKVRWAIVPYTRGRGLDIGAGEHKAFPHFISVDNGDHGRFGYKIKPDIRVQDATDLSLFGDHGMDFVFSSHLLEHLADVGAALKEWWRLVKPGGHLVLYLPHKDFYPQLHDKGEFARVFASQLKRHGGALSKAQIEDAISLVVKLRQQRGVTKIGELYAGSGHANSDHKQEFHPDDILAEMVQLAGSLATSEGWDCVENQTRHAGTEYSFLQVYRKIDTALPRESWRAPQPAKTVGVVRYGAYGDLIMASSVLAGLKEQGYHVTLFGSPPGLEVLDHDPHIDARIIQDRDQVPNQCLGEYWDYWEQRFDKWVNLSGSVEDALLAAPHVVQHRWPQPIRHKYLNRNYLEFSHELAGVPFTPRPHFYATRAEVDWARQQAIGGVNLLWSLAGSSLHKTWDGLDQILARILIEYPTAHVTLVGGPECQLLESGWETEPRIHKTCGVWSVRQSMAFLSVADLVIGPETGVLNAASMLEVPKIVFLSHSSVENLTRDWRQCISLVSTTTPCYPCHQLHLNSDGWDKFCPRTPRLDGAGQQRGVAHCQGEITPAQVWDAVRGVLDRQRDRQAA